MNQTRRLENKIASLKKINLIDNMLIDILSTEIGEERIEVLLEENNFALRSMSIEKGRMMSNEQAEEFKKIVTKDD